MMLDKKTGPAGDNRTGLNSTLESSVIVPDSVEKVKSPEVAFSDLFSGLKDAHGRTELTGEITKKGKAVAKGLLVKKPAKLSNWTDHIAGKTMLGIAPLRRDGSCLFGAIDVDVYSLDLSRLDKKIQYIGLPLLTVRSKSGGAHLYIFFGEPTSARRVRRLLATWATALGHPGVEVFPKQDQLGSENEYGSWLNMPYFGGDETNRWAIGPGCISLQTEEFLELAEKRKTSIDVTEAIELPSGESLVSEPANSPRLTDLAEGNRHIDLMSIAGTMRARGVVPEAIEAALLEDNAMRGDPPLPESEVMGIVNYIGRKQPGSNDYLPLNDVGNAQRLAAFAHEKLRYVWQWKTWVAYDGKRWVVDKAFVWRAAKQVAAAIYTEAGLVAPSDEDRAKKISNWAHKSHFSSNLSSMIQLARDELTAAPKDFDSNSNLLNVNNGTIDVRTMTFREHDPTDMIMKMTPVEFDPDAECPQFISFLDRIMGGNENLVSYLQRLTGYCLTGETGEQLLNVFYGTGANGKSTFLESISSVLGDYATKAEMTSFVHKQHDPVRNDIARLKGSRIVTAVEIGEGRRLNEALIKEVTGGDMIAARFLYGEYFEFRPQFKLILAANDKPEIRGQDEAIWRRVKLVPFEVYIPPEERDKNLQQKLEAESAGILKWAMEGCRQWLEVGLNPPPEVEAASEEYRREMDFLGDFLEECSETGEELVTTCSNAFTQYERYCDENGEEPVKKRTFGRLMKERGFPSKNSKVFDPIRGKKISAKVYHGIDIFEVAF